MCAEFYVGDEERNENFQVFISYGRETATDKVVDEIEEYLLQKGLTVFVDRSCLKPGALWSAKMVGAIKSCKVFIPILTKKYVLSKFCHGELYEAEAQGKDICPVVLEGDWKEKEELAIAARPIHEIVHSRQYSFCDTPKKREKNLPELIQSITEKLPPELGM